MKNNNLNYIDENLLKVSRLTNEVVLENMGTSMNGFFISYYFIIYRCNISK